MDYLNARKTLDASFGPQFRAIHSDRFNPDLFISHPFLSSPIHALPPSDRDAVGGQYEARVSERGRV